MGKENTTAVTTASNLAEKIVQGLVERERQEQEKNNQVNNQFFWFYYTYYDDRIKSPGSHGKNNNSIKLLKGTLSVVLKMIINSEAYNQLDDTAKDSVKNYIVEKLGSILENIRKNGKNIDSNLKILFSKKASQFNSYLFAKEIKEILQVIDLGKGIINVNDNNNNNDINVEKFLQEKIALFLTNSNKLNKFIKVIKKNGDQTVIKILQESLDSKEEKPLKLNELSIIAESTPTESDLRYHIQEIIDVICSHPATVIQQGYRFFPPSMNYFNQFFKSKPFKDIFINNNQLKAIFEEKLENMINRGEEIISWLAPYPFLWDLLSIDFIKKFDAINYSLDFSEKNEDEKSNEAIAFRLRIFNRYCTEIGSVETNSIDVSKYLKIFSLLLKNASESSNDIEEIINSGFFNTIFKRITYITLNVLEPISSVAANSKLNINQKYQILNLFYDQIFTMLKSGIKVQNLESIINSLLTLAIYYFPKNKLQDIIYEIEELNKIITINFYSAINEAFPSDSLDKIWDLNNDENTNLRKLIILYLENLPQDNSSIINSVKHFNLILKNSSCMTENIWVTVLNGIYARYEISDDAISNLLSNEKLLINILKNKRLHDNNYLCNNIETLLAKHKERIENLLISEKEIIYEKIFKYSKLISSVEFCTNYPFLFSYFSKSHQFSIQQIEQYVSKKESREIFAFIEGIIEHKDSLNVYERTLLKNIFIQLVKQNKLIEVLKEGDLPNEMFQFFDKESIGNLDKNSAIEILDIYKNYLGEIGNSNEIYNITIALINAARGIGSLKEYNLLSDYKNFLKESTGVKTVLEISIRNLRSQNSTTFFQDNTACELLFLTGAIESCDITDIENLINSNHLYMIELLTNNKNDQKQSYIDKFYGEKPQLVKSLFNQFPDLMQGLTASTLAFVFEDLNLVSSNNLESPLISDINKQYINRIAEDNNQIHFFANHPKLLRHVPITTVLEMAENNQEINQFLQGKEAPLEMIEKLVITLEGLEYLARHPLLLERLSSPSLTWAHYKYPNIKEYIDSKPDLKGKVDYNTLAIIKFNKQTADDNDHEETIDENDNSNDYPFESNYVDLKSQGKISAYEGESDYHDFHNSKKAAESDTIVDNAYTLFSQESAVNRSVTDEHALTVYKKPLPYNPEWFEAQIQQTQSAAIDQSACGLEPSEEQMSQMEQTASATVGHSVPVTTEEASSNHNIEAKLDYLTAQNQQQAELINNQAEKINQLESKIDYLIVQNQQQAKKNNNLEAKVDHLTTMLGKLLESLPPQQDPQSTSSPNYKP